MQGENLLNHFYHLLDFDLQAETPVINILFLVECVQKESTSASYVLYLLSMDKFKVLRKSKILSDFSSLLRKWGG